MSKRSDWDRMSKDERIKAIRPLAAKGQSAAQIAGNFLNVSRNAVIGYCVRHDIKLERGKKGFTKTRQTEIKKAAVKKPKVKQPEVIKRSESVLAFVAETVGSDRPAPDIVNLGPISKSQAFDPIEGVAPVRLEDIGARQCHWPVNGFNGFEPILCGAAASSLYCENHQRLAYAARAN